MKRQIVTLTFLAAMHLGCMNDLSQNPSNAQNGGSSLWTAEGSEIDEFLRPDEAASSWSQTEWLGKPVGHNRIGLRFDARGVVLAEIRVSSDGGSTVSLWKPFELVFKEGFVHNARSEVSTTGAWFQIRIKEPSESEMSFIAVEALHAGKPGGTENPVQLQAPGREESGLSAEDAVTRDGWGGQASGCLTQSSKNRVTFQHTVTPNSDSVSMAVRLRQIQSYHMDVRGWCDIGYHFMIGQDGLVYNGRGDNLAGAYSIAAQSDNISVSFVGRHCSLIPSENSLEAAAFIVGDVAHRYSIPTNREFVKSYYEYGGSSCAGLSAAADEIVSRAQDLLPGSNDTDHGDEPEPVAANPEEPSTESEADSPEVEDEEDIVDAQEEIEIDGGVAGGETDSETDSVPEPPSCFVSVSGPATAEILHPTLFNGHAASGVHQVVVRVDEWFIGSAVVTQGAYELEYAFSGAAQNRLVEAFAQNSQGDVLCKSSTLIDVLAPDAEESPEPASGAEALELPYYYQYANSINPGGSCQNTSMAMVLKKYGASVSTPDSISSYYGTSQAQTVTGFQTVFNSEAVFYGLSIRDSGTSQGTIAEMREILESGMPVVVHGFFTSYGHVMVVLGYENGQYEVHDPAGQWNETYQGGGYGGWNPTAGRYGKYNAAAFEAAIAPDNLVWMHRFYFVDE
jgi:hypothetical protein